MRVVVRVTYKDLFDEAKDESREAGSNLGTKARSGAEIVNAAAKAGVAIVAFYSVIGAGLETGCRSRT